MKRFTITTVEVEGTTFYKIARDGLEFDSLYPHPPQERVDALNGQVNSGEVDKIARPVTTLLAELGVLASHLPWDQGDQRLGEIEDSLMALLADLGAKVEVPV